MWCSLGIVVGGENPTINGNDAAKVNVWYFILM
jgi:hypothetical protein